MKLTTATAAAILAFCTCAAAFPTASTPSTTAVATESTPATTSQSQTDAEQLDALLDEEISVEDFLSALFVPVYDPYYYGPSPSFDYAPVAKREADPLFRTTRLRDVLGYWNRGPSPDEVPQESSMHKREADPLFRTTRLRDVLGYWNRGPHPDDVAGQMAKREADPLFRKTSLRDVLGYWNRGPSPDEMAGVDAE